MELAILLQELLKRGWKAFGKYDKLMTFGQDWGTKTFGFGVLGEVRYSIRELVSKESGLWQFCVKNKLVSVGKTYIMAYTKRFRDVYELKKDEADEYSDTEYEYWLIESALRDESELEQFLLDNIKIEGKQTI